MEFLKDFIFGVATSAYQIEGGASAGGRTPSIWDEFCLKPGKVVNDDNGNIACDHYKLYEEDIELMKKLGIDCYRFSISWPRIFPNKGEYNPEGMEYYKKILQKLKMNGIKTSITMYHWDLPIWAERLGGWGVRDSVEWYLEFAEKCFKELDEFADFWVTHNEPWCISILSNFIGEHAPGNRNLDEALRVAHHILVSHGKAIKLYRDKYGEKPIGIVLNLNPVYPNSDSYEDKLAANNFDAMFNRYFLDPIFKGTYPYEIANCGGNMIKSFDFIKPGDFEIISEKIDFLGVNYYSRSIGKYDSNNFLNYSGATPKYPVTAMGWEVYPEGLYDLIKRIRNEYTELPIYITENGCAYNDILTEDERVHDLERIDYLKNHLKVISDLNKEGMNIAGYFVWSLLDNFEWAHGYSKRFGLVYVNYENQKRIPKDSFEYYSKIIKSR